MELFRSKLGWLILFTFLEVKTSLHINNDLQYNSSRDQKWYNDSLMVVRLTQKGYIQFLRYVVDVPELKEYTFCLWVRSLNLTHSHPLISYSKNEEERLIRVWISPHGTSINLEILGIPVFKIATKFKENRWYHICQSLTLNDGSWEIFINQNFIMRGATPKLAGLRITSGGDIVVGQEYTDFDKGLDDGIEGDIFGFNFVLSATSSTSRSHRKFLNGKPRYNESTSLYSFPQHKVSHRYAEYSSFPDVERFNRVNFILKNHDSKPKTKNQIIIRRAPARLPVRNVNSVNFPLLQNYADKSYNLSPSSKSLGMRLVELSRNCWMGKGAPLSDKKVLISWTKSIVRVFGGAVLKHVKPFC